MNQDLIELKEYCINEKKRYYELINKENNTSQNCLMYQGQIKAYNKIIEQINYRKFVRDIKKNPVKYVEDFYNIKLLPCQKVLIKLLSERK